MANEDIKEALQKHNIKQWQLADALGVADTTLCRWLRHELSDREKQNILDWIKEDAK